MKIQSISNNYSPISNQKIDLEIYEIKPQFSNQNYQQSILVIISHHQKNLAILFHLLDQEDLIENQILLEKETGLMFFMTNNQYGIVDLNLLKIIEQRNSFNLGFPERIKNSIILEDEISAKSYSIAGKFIAEVPIDPPASRRDFDDYLEYESSFYGKMKLKIE